MTNEQAIRRLEDLQRLYLGNEKFTADIEAIGIAIEALKQQPCEDCISRQRVLDIINFEYKWLLDAKVYDICTSIAFSAIMSKISEMPSVTPTRPTGKWIRDTITDLYHCSECRTIYHQDVKTMDNYCPNCGAKMVESEEEV